MAEYKAPDVATIKERITFASDLYDASRSQMDEVEDLFTGDYVTEKLIKDTGIKYVKPPRAMAILFKFVSRLATRAEMGIQVVPRTLGEGEEKTCTTLERWLEGYKFQAEYEAMDPIYRYFVTWFCLRGRGCLELRLRPQYAKEGEYLVVKPIVDDPKTISPVYGETGIMYYAKQYERYAWDLKDELGDKVNKGSELMWNMPEALAKKKATETCEVMEYWDRNWHAAFIDDELVFSKANLFGFVPLVEAKAMDTPLEAAEWASQSILHPIMDMLKKQAELMSKGITGLELYFWPRVYYRGPDGRSYWIDSDPTSVETLPPDGEFVVIHPTPNYMLLQQLNSMCESEIGLLALPEIAWGAEPGTLQSGRAISQVLAQTLDVIEDKRINLERTLSWHFGGVLRLVETFAQLADGDKFTVMAIPEEEGKKRRDLIGIGKDEVDGHHRVLVNLSPPLPEDKMVRYEIAKRAREIGKDGFPMLDDHTIISEVLEISNPDEVKERIEKQMARRMSPEIMAYFKMKYLQEFCEEQKISLEQFIEMAQKGMAGVMGGQQGGEMGGQPPLPRAEEEIGRPGPAELSPEEYEGGPAEPGPEEAAMLGGGP